MVHSVLLQETFTTMSWQYN